MAPTEQPESTDFDLNITCRQTYTYNVIQHEMFEIFNEETFEFDEKMYFFPD